MAVDVSDHMPPRRPLAFILWCSRPQKWWFLAAFAAVCTGAAFDRIQQLVIKIVTDTATDAQFSAASHAGTLWFWALLYPIIYLLAASSWRASGFCGSQAITRTSAFVYRSLYEYLSHHSTRYFNDRFAGVLTNKISNAAGGAESLQGRTLWEFTGLTCTFIGNVALTYYAHWLLMCAFLAWFAVYVTVLAVRVRGVRKYAFSHAERSSQLKGTLVDSVSNIESVHLLANLPYEQQYVASAVENKRAAHLRSWRSLEWVLVSNNALLAVFSLSMLSLSVYLLVRGEITVGSLVMMIAIVVGLERSLFFIGHSISQAVQDYAQVKEGLEELLGPHEVVDAPQARPLRVERGEIRFEGVAFSYPATAVFKDLSLYIRAGQKVGLVGVSGSGKSTLASLLLRQYDLQSGSITIDGRDIAQVTLESLRRSIAFVPQSTSLFHRTIGENIRYGRLDASDAEMEEAARRAFAHEFITSLPKGYHTYVGERGIKLSGGQRQRVAIARAVLKNAPILVLDEATSALDSESEAAIQRALSDLMERKTVLAIAHRLSTLLRMDRIVVLEDGVIIEDGAHAELLARGGRYAQLWESQVSGYIPG